MNKKLKRLVDRDHFLELIQILIQRPLRTGLSGLGVGWGLFMIIITIGSANGLENGVSQDLSDSAKNSMFLWTQSTSLPYKGFKRGRNVDLNLSDVEYLKANSQTLVAIAPQNELGGWRGSNNVTRGIKTGAFTVFGEYPEQRLIEAKPIVTGRHINNQDIAERRKIAVIGKRVRDILFSSDEDPIGGSIRINGVNFVVVGVFGSLRTGEDAEEDLQSVLIPFSTFNQSFNYGDEVSWLCLLFDENVHADSAASEVMSVLKSRLSIHPDDDRAFGHWTVAEEYEQIQSVFGAIRWVSIVFGGLALLAGIIGIMNIMLITVRERTNELGVRRALGASPGMIVRQIMGETLFLTSLFGVIGAVLGVATIEGIDALLQSTPSMDGGSFRNPEVSVDIVIKSLVIMVFMGAIAGILPALRAVSIRPVEAIRTE
ncbi:MAG: multidrug ABC transporter ATP-binding protein [Crocinitomicaceae bacterium]|jgi:putative ABC transport system permease protein|nr:multidrug ABC transporter ATP-binding protein [Crocinitomicaceae bacterium]